MYPHGYVVGVGLTSLNTCKCRYGSLSCSIQVVMECTTFLVDSISISPITLITPRITYDPSPKYPSSTLAGVHQLFFPLPPLTGMAAPKVACFGGLSPATVSQLIPIARLAYQGTLKDQLIFHGVSETIESLGI